MRRVHSVQDTVDRHTGVQTAERRELHTFEVMAKRWMSGIPPERMLGMQSSIQCKDHLGDPCGSPFL
jgi:hypothetical protein